MNGLKGIAIETSLGSKKKIIFLRDTCVKGVVCVNGARLIRHKRM